MIFFFFYQKHELPNYLCGTIGYGILKNPVVTPCGLSYDRKDIEEHLMVLYF